MIMKDPIQNSNIKKIFKILDDSNLFQINNKSGFYIANGIMFSASKFYNLILSHKDLKYAFIPDNFKDSYGIVKYDGKEISGTTIGLAEFLSEINDIGGYEDFLRKIIFNLDLFSQFNSEQLGFFGLLQKEPLMISKILINPKDYEDLLLWGLPE